jgi:hypothetical protein
MLLCYAAQRTCMLLAWCPVTNIKYCMHIHHNNNPNNTKQIYRNDWEMGQTSNNLWPSMKNYQDLAKKEIAFCKDHDLFYWFSKSKSTSPTTLPTIIYGQTFYNLTRQLPPHYQWILFPPPESPLYSVNYWTQKGNCQISSSLWKLMING